MFPSVGAQREASEKSSAGFTRSLKRALGGHTRISAVLRTFQVFVRDGFHASPRPSGAKARSSAGFTLLLAALVTSIVL